MLSERAPRPMSALRERVVFGGGAWADRMLFLARAAAVGAGASVTFSTALTSVLLALLALCWLASGRAAETGAAALRHPLGVAIAVFLLVLAAGLLYAPSPAQAGLDTLWSWRKLLVMLVLLGLFSETRWKARFARAFIAVCALGLVVSFASWLEWLPAYGGRGPGIVLQNHATQGMVFSLGALCAGVLAREAAPRWKRVLGVLIVLFAANVVFVCTGRSGYLALFVVAAFLALNRFGWRRLPWVTVAAPAVMALVMLASPTVNQRVVQAYEEAFVIDPGQGFSSVGFRRHTYENAIALIRERPLLGYGTGSFAKVYSDYVGSRFADWRGAPATDPHSQYLYIGFENGIVGLLAFFGIVAAAFVSAARCPTFGAIGAGALMVWLATSLFNSHFTTFGEGHLIALFLGVMLAGCGQGTAAADAVTRAGIPGAGAPARRPGDARVPALPGDLRVGYACHCAA